MHMWTQIVGKVRLKLCPLVNHFWNVPFYLTARGMTTSAMPYPGAIEARPEVNRRNAASISLTHKLLIESSDAGVISDSAESPRAWPNFTRTVHEGLRGSLALGVKIWTTPCEIPDPIPFEKDNVHAAYDAEAVTKFWRILSWVDQVSKEFRAGFIGKASPVHFFWGSFDLAVTRFSGRRAPERPGPMRSRAKRTLTR